MGFKRGRGLHVVTLVAALLQERCASFSTTTMALERARGREGGASASTTHSRRGFFSSAATAALAVSPALVLAPAAPASDGAASAKAKTALAKVRRELSSSAPAGRVGLTLDEAVALVQEHGQSALGASLDSGGEVFYRGEDSSSSPSDETTFVVEEPDLLLPETYDSKEAAEYFALLDEALQGPGFEAQARPATAHVVTTDRRAAALWGEPAVVWPLGEELHWTWMEHSFDFWDDGWATLNKTALAELKKQSAASSSLKSYISNNNDDKKKKANTSTSPSTTLQAQLAAGALNTGGSLLNGNRGSLWWRGERAIADYLNSGCVVDAFLPIAMTSRHEIMVRSGALRDNSTNKNSKEKGLIASNGFVVIPGRLEGEMRQKLGLPAAPTALNPRQVSGVVGEEGGEGEELWERDLSQLRRHNR